ncbi:hypothetical protein P7C70_g3958, partial [Phenoliferia sp. Uapishka_3]
MHDLNPPAATTAMAEKVRSPPWPLQSSMGAQADTILDQSNAADRILATTARLGKSFADGTERYHRLTPSAVQSELKALKGRVILLEALVKALYDGNAHQPGDTSPQPLFNTELPTEPPAPSSLETTDQDFRYNLPAPSCTSHSLSSWRPATPPTDNAISPSFSIQDSSPVTAFQRTPFTSDLELNTDVNFVSPVATCLQPPWVYEDGIARIPDEHYSHFDTAQNQYPHALVDFTGSTTPPLTEPFPSNQSLEFPGTFNGTSNLDDFHPDDSPFVSFTRLYRPSATNLDTKFSTPEYPLPQDDTPNAHYYRNEQEASQDILVITGEGGQQTSMAGWSM